MPKYPVTATRAMAPTVSHRPARNLRSRGSIFPPLLSSDDGLEDRCLLEGARSVPWRFARLLTRMAAQADGALKGRGRSGRQQRREVGIRDGGQAQPIENVVDGLERSPARHGDLDTDRIPAGSEADDHARLYAP